MRENLVKRHEEIAEYWSDDEGTDAQLCERLVLGEQDALRLLYCRHGDACYALACRLTADTSIAERVVQDLFVGLWRCPEQFDRSRGSLRSFLIARTHHWCIELLRSQAAPSQYQNWDADEHQHLSSVDVSDHVDMSDRERLVRSAVASLHPRQLEAIELAYFGGRNYREVADKLGVAEGTITGRIRMGLLVLRERTASI